MLTLPIMEKLYVFYGSSLYSKSCKRTLSKKRWVHPIIEM